MPENSLLRAARIASLTTLFDGNTSADRELDDCLDSELDDSLDSELDGSLDMTPDPGSEPARSAAARLAVDAAGELPFIRAVLVGNRDADVWTLFADVLGEIGVSLELPPAPLANVVIAVLDRWMVEAVLLEARTMAPGTPIVAILPFHDDRFYDHVLGRGVHACYAFTTPLSELRAALAIATSARR